MIGWMILGCEIGFWVFVFAGLLTRYILKHKKIGALFLLCTPLIDLVLILTTIIDMKNGTQANFFHGLAAVYLGMTIVYGHGMIQWMDKRFAHRFADGPKPTKPARFGLEHAKIEREGWLKHLLAYLIGNGILYGMIFYIGNDVQTRALTNITNIWTTVLCVDFLISFSYTIWPKKEQNSRSSISEI